MLKKFGMGLALTATFGLLACSDSSSGSGGGKVTISCKVLKEEPLTIKSSEGGISGTITYDRYKDGKVVETYEFSSDAVAKEECEEMEKDASYEEVDCDGKKITTVSSDEATDTEFKSLVKMLKEECVASDGKTVKMDDDGTIDLDDEDNKDLFGEDDEDDEDVVFKTSSCEFDVNKDKWEYSYSGSKDLTGAVSSGEVTYEFKSDSYTIIRTTRTKGGYISTTCSYESALDQMNSEYEDEYVKSKMETYCEGNVLISKSTTTNIGSDYDKESLLEGAVSSCQSGY